MWKDEWAHLLEDVAVVVWQEPDAEDFTERLARALPGLTVIARPPFKDLSEAHIAGEDIPALVERLRSQAKHYCLDKELDLQDLVERALNRFLQTKGVK